MLRIAAHSVILGVFGFVIMGCVSKGAQKVNSLQELESIKKIEAFDYKSFSHIGIVVGDVEKAAGAYAAMFGVEEPKWFITEPEEKAKTRYKGKPTKARAKLAFMKIDGRTIELIEPVGTASTWWEFLDSKGGGVHHIAFDVKGIDKQIKTFEKNGMPLIQQGRWTDSGGGRYAYMDTTRQLGVLVELLESF